MISNKGNLVRELAYELPKTIRLKKLQENLLTEKNDSTRDKSHWQQEKKILTISNLTILLKFQSSVKYFVQHCKFKKIRKQT